MAEFLDTIDASMGLDQRQYDEIERLLLERRPPLRLERSAVCVNPHAAEQLVALAELAAVDAGRLQSALSDRQWKALAPWREQGARSRTHAETMGILDKVPE